MLGWLLKQRPYMLISLLILPSPLKAVPVLERGREWFLLPSLPHSNLSVRSQTNFGFNPFPAGHQHRPWALSSPCHHPYLKHALPLKFDKSIFLKLAVGVGVDLGLNHLGNPKASIPSRQLQTMLEHHQPAPAQLLIHRGWGLVVSGHSQSLQLTGLSKSLPLFCL